MSPGIKSSRLLMPSRSKINSLFISNSYFLDSFLIYYNSCACRVNVDVGAVVSVSRQFFGEIEDVEKNLDTMVSFFF
jgi:hypothetical protein